MIDQQAEEETDYFRKLKQDYDIKMQMAEQQDNNENGNNTIYEDTRENLSETQEGNQMRLNEQNVNLEDSIENGRISQSLSANQNI